MLRVARERVARNGLGHVKSLRVMDAVALEFRDARFDVALAPYVMSVVAGAEPRARRDVASRQAGGQLVVMNHFAAERGPRAKLEALMEASAGWLGWHPQFPTPRSATGFSRAKARN